MFRPVGNYNGSGIGIGILYGYDGNGFGSGNIGSSDGFGFGHAIPYFSHAFGCDGFGFPIGYDGWGFGNDFGYGCELGNGWATVEISRRMLRKGE